MRNHLCSIAAPLLGICVLGLAACETTPKSDDPAQADTSRQASEPAPSATLAQRLESVKPQLDVTMASLDSVVSSASGSGLQPAVANFSQQLGALRAQADKVIDELDRERRGSDAWFLERDRTVAISSQPGVLESREELGFVGEYLVQLRRDYQKLMEDFRGIESGIVASPTADKVNAAAPLIASAHRNARNVSADIDVLLAEMQRVRFNK